MAGLGAGIEEKILTLLVWNTELASSVALDVDPTIFATKHFRLIAKSAIEYIMRYNEAPKNHLPDILEHELSKGDEGKLLWTTIGRMEEINTDVNYEFVLDELNDYIATRRFDKVLENARDLIHKGKRSEAEEMVFSFAGTSADLPGIWSHQPEFTGFMNKDEEDEFHLGIEALDSRGVKPSRKTLFVILAPKKRGKSMCLINIGKEAAFVDHKNVLHITLEMSAAQTAKRYTQAIGGYTAGETLEKNLQIWRFRRDSEGQYSGTECESWPAESLDQQSRVKVSENLAKVSRGKPRLLIKEFPTRSLTSAQLVMFLERLRRREKFVPDLLIVDYANEMYMNAQNIRTETGRIFRDLRGIAVSRNMAVVTATQGNRLSDSAKLVSGIHVAEDWSVMGVADTVVSICRTPEEAQKHLARLYVIAARDVSDQFIVQITQNYEICRFAVDSIYMTKSVQQDLDRLLNDEEDD